MSKIFSPSNLIESILVQPSSLVSTQQSALTYNKSPYIETKITEKIASLLFSQHRDSLKDFIER